MWAALDYAAAGFAVFPCVPRAKAPLTAHGWQDASTDPYLIRHWWERWPTANIGIACGRVSGIVVLDVDTKKGARGYETLRVIVDKVGEITSASVSTPSSGLHLYFRYPDCDTPSWKDGQLGLELKSDGTYVLAPPSVVDYRPEDGPCPTGFYSANGPLTRCRITEAP
jgi:hypothetical protein